MSLTIKPADQCQFDQISLGEIMLRLDPGEGRVRTTRHFTVWEGGGEYNTSRGLRKCFRLKTAVCTALVDNEVGHLVEDLLMQGGVATDFIKWREDDGIGRTVRNGLNFTERGFGIRGAVGVSDRGHTAASQLKPGDFDWDHIFGHLGVRWLHTGGIFAALSETTAQLAIEAVKAAHRHGTIVSYDLNYRPSLWKASGGLKKAQEVNREITATQNDWSALLWHDGRFCESRKYPGLEILDRVGGGDSFASGLQFGFLQFNDPQKAVDYGAAHGALASTTPGDTSMATRQEVEKTMGGGSARVVR